MAPGTEVQGTLAKLCAVLPSLVTTEVLRPEVVDAALEAGGVERARLTVAAQEDGLSGHRPVVQRGVERAGRVLRVHSEAHIVPGQAQSEVVNISVTHRHLPHNQLSQAQVDCNEAVLYGHSQEVVLLALLALPQQETVVVVGGELQGDLDHVETVVVQDLGFQLNKALGGHQSELCPAPAILQGLLPLTEIIFLLLTVLDAPAGASA